MTNKTCHKCGKCCQLLIFRLGIELPRDLAEFYTAFCCDIIDGNIHIHKRCQHLTETNECAIHDNKPKVCSAFKGPDSKKYYIHEGCGLA